jgi:hypothetical protein
MTCKFKSNVVVNLMMFCNKALFNIGKVYQKNQFFFDPDSADAQQTRAIQRNQRVLALARARVRDVCYHQSMTVAKTISGKVDVR